MSEKPKITVSDFAVAPRAKRSAPIEALESEAIAVEDQAEITEQKTVEKGPERNLLLDDKTPEQRLSAKKVSAAERAASRLRLESMKRTNRRETMTSINVPMSFELKHRLDAAKLKHGTPVQQIVRQAIEALLEANGL